MSTPNIIEQQLQQGFTAMHMTLPVQPFLQYLQLLSKWNRAYNLTAILDMETMVTRHIFDSLAIIPWLKGTRVLDVGSGAGLPGIPLALALPELHVTLLDSNGKKVRFLREIKRQLALDNIEIVQNRVESYRIGNPFDTVVSRAFSDLSQMVQWTAHVLHVDGIWLAMKGRIPEAELDQLQHSYHVASYQVPGIVGERCCVIIDNKLKEPSWQKS